MHDKSGQFFLIAALVIAGLIIGITTISNYSRADSAPELVELKEEIRIEGENVMDYATYNRLTQQQRFSVFSEFLDLYLDANPKNKNFYFIFGNKNNLTLKGYQVDGNTVSLNGQVVTTFPGEFIRSIDPPSNDIVLTINGNSYDFKLSEGESFYFLITKKERHGEYIIIG